MLFIFCLFFFPLIPSLTFLFDLFFSLLILLSVLFFAFLSFCLFYPFLSFFLSYPFFYLSFPMSPFLSFLLLPLLAFPSFVFHLAFPFSYIFLLSPSVLSFISQKIALYIFLFNSLCFGGREDCGERAGGGFIITSIIHGSTQLISQQ